VARGQRRSRSSPEAGPDEKRFWCKIFQTRHDLVAAMCDKAVLDKTFEDGKLKIRVNRHFYEGVLISERVALRILRRMSIGNLVGKEIVEVALRGGFITEENLIIIDGVPHAQFVKI
jgi:hypothetical protein